MVLKHVSIYFPDGLFVPNENPLGRTASPNSNIAWSWQPTRVGGKIQDTETKKHKKQQPKQRLLGARKYYFTIKTIPFLHEEISTPKVFRPDLNRSQAWRLDCVTSWERVDQQTRRANPHRGGRESCLRVLNLQTSIFQTESHRTLVPLRH